MGRKRNPSGGEAFVQLVALMPWWAGVALAIVAYAFLHHFAIPPISAPVLGPGQGVPLARMVLGGIWRALAQVGQYVVPVLSLTGAGVSAWKRRQSRELVLRATEMRDAEAVDGMTWREFERLVAEAFRRRGYTASETGGDGPDGGIDILLAKGSEKFLVQCKHWRAQRVGVDVVRQLYGVMAARGATGGFVVTSGRYSSDAQAFAQGRNIKLIDGIGLRRLLDEGSVAPAAAAPPPAATTPARSAPQCPVCNAKMIRRSARRGANAGNEFWGCERFPECRGTRPA